MDEMIRIPTVIYRGGTSKAVFLKENDLPGDAKIRDKVICAIFGSPDKRQIDGLGGADPLTSKLAIIGPPSRPDADVDYTFGQVSIDSTVILYGAVCGNVSAAVGPYAIDEGYVRPTEPETKVRIHCTNNGRIIEATVPVIGNRVRVHGDFAIDGVPGTGARIELNWSDMVGANTGRLLPTGNAQDILDVEGVGKVTMSIVDVANPGIFIRASDVGLKGTESPEEIDANQELLRKSDAITRVVMDKIKNIALLTYVAPPADYVKYGTGETLKADQVDLLVRMIFMGKLHKTFAASMINCCGTAAMVPGTLVNEVASPGLTERGMVRMGHPSGSAELEGVEIRETPAGIEVKKIIVYRTARRLMEGYSFVKKEVF
ncbi:MAG TPA: PrpF domain-containing protein [Deltaproteobacteria bacterium]|nr:PrpF domain-containing protein [Deltaproteobacteria bacterium]